MQAKAYIFKKEGHFKMARKKIIAGNWKMNKTPSEAVALVNELKPLHKIILYKRYIKGKTVEEIAIEINYSYYETCRINGNALEEFDKLDKESKKTQDFAKKSR